MSKEDTMVAEIIDYHRDSGVPGETSWEYEFEPEAHYNYYGDRGVADLHVRRKETESYGRPYINDDVYEVKSAAAVEAATGANEIIRQFNKMRRYFYKDESRYKPSTTSFELVFIVEKETVKHVAENITLYQVSDDQKLCKCVMDSSMHQESVFLRNLDGGINEMPVQVNYSKRSGPEVVDGSTWKQNLENISTEGSYGSVINILEELGY